MAAEHFVSPILLASASPRRHDLLRWGGVPVEVQPADIDEAPMSPEEPLAYVIRVAAAKRDAVAGREPHRVVLAADTTVDLDGEILAKPADADDARSMLGRLGGRTHLVHTAVAVGGSVPAGEIVVTTEVTFGKLDDRAIDAYVATGEPFGKAGAYAIQGVGGVLVARIEGSLTNVIGLPMVETLELLRSAMPIG